MINLFSRESAVKKTYQGAQDKSKQKFEVIGKRRCWWKCRCDGRGVEEMQAEVDQLTGQAGLRIISAILENEVTRRVGRRTARAGIGAVRWGGSRVMWCLAGGRWASSDHGCARGKARKWNWTVTRGCSTTGGGSERTRRNRRGADFAELSRAVQSVVEGYGIEKSA